jgi:type IV secretory pathway VirB6-like protein
MYSRLIYSLLVVWGLLLFQSAPAMAQAAADAIDCTPNPSDPDQQPTCILPGAKIEYGLCDPSLAASENRGDLPAHEQSCEAQNITRDGEDGTRKFAVRVTFQPSRPATQSDGSGWGSFGGAVGVINNLFNRTFSDGGQYDTSARIFLQEHAVAEMDIEPEAFGEAIINESRILFHARYEYNKACVYAYLQGDPRIFRVARNFPTTPDTVNGDITYQGSDGVELAGGNTLSNRTATTLADNCVYAPAPPRSSAILSWSAMISDVCINYDDSASRYRVMTPGGLESRSFTGVVVECIEETFMNLFNPPSAVYGASFFTRMQDQFQNIISLLLVLYVVIYGLQIVLKQSIPKPNELTWFWLRIGLVLWFAGGNGMTQLYPMLVNSSKDLSAMVFEAGRGRIDDPTYHELRERVNLANADLSVRQSRVTELTNQIIQAQNALGDVAQGVDQRRADYYSIYRLLYGNDKVPAGTTLVPLATPPSPPITSGAEYAVIDKDLKLNRPLTAAQSGMTLIELLGEDPAPGAAVLLNIAEAEKSAAESAYSNSVNTYNTAMSTLLASLTAAGSVTDTSSGGGSYNVPLGCSRIEVELWGGGAAGRWDVGCTTECDYSGGAGGYARGRFDVTGGNSFSYNVGGGGRSKGASGGTSWFSSIGALAASGGSGKNGGSGSGTVLVQAWGGGDGTASTCRSVPGGTPPFGSANSATCSGGVVTSLGSAGAGGCSSDDTCANTTYGYGSDGKLVVNCIQMGDLTDAQIATLASSGDATIRANAIAVQNAKTARDNAHRDMVVAGGTAQVRQVIDSITVEDGDTMPNNNYEVAQVAYNNALAEYNNAVTVRDDLLGQLDMALADYNAALASYNTALALLDNLGGLEAQLDTAEDELSDSQDALDAATDSFTSHLISMPPPDTPGVGYNYCDFSLETYDSGKEYMRLWDMVDCKLSTYLGVGLHPSDPHAPQSILLALTSVISSEYGMLILFFTVIFFVFMIMLVLRIVHIYIMAFIGISLLVYISPLVIPAALFKHTKGVFDKWLREIISRLLQPVILFAFLALLFGVTDHVFFGENKRFTTENRIINKDGGSTPPGVGETHLCEDPEAIGCIYQTARYYSIPVFAEEFKLFSLQKVDLGGGRGFDLFIGLVKMIFICFVVFAILKIVEELSYKLTGGVSSGAAAMAGFNPPSPRQIGAAMTNSAAAAYGGAKAAGKKAAKRQQSAKGRKDKRDDKKKDDKKDDKGEDKDNSSPDKAGGGEARDAGVDTSSATGGSSTEGIGDSIESAAEGASEGADGGGG